VFAEVSKKDKPTAMENRAAKNTVYVATREAGKNNRHPRMYTLKPMSRPVL
jgi:hypothetical protein